MLEIVTRNSGRGICICRSPCDALEMWLNRTVLIDFHVTCHVLNMPSWLPAREQHTHYWSDVVRFVLSFTYRLRHITQLRGDGPSNHAVRSFVSDVCRLAECDSQFALALMQSISWTSRTSARTMRLEQKTSRAR